MLYILPDLNIIIYLVQHVSKDFMFDVIKHSNTKQHSENTTPVKTSKKTVFISAQLNT